MALLIILGVWAAISIATHFPFFPGNRLTFLRDIGVIPQWNFFAPQPPKGDLIILYRDKLETKEVSNWREVKTKTRNTHWCWIWNPQKRNNKGILDIVNDLIMQTNQLRESGMDENRKQYEVIQSIPYLLILQFVFNHSSEFAGNQRQFAIVLKTRQEFTTVFTSNFHNLNI
ncbi:MAG: hypothetical protein WBP58_15365 [Chitinophagaceae bacterium]